MRLLVGRTFGIAVQKRVDVNPARCWRRRASSLRGRARSALCLPSVSSPRGRRERNTGRTVLRGGEPLAQMGSRLPRSSLHSARGSPTRRGFTVLAFYLALLAVIAAAAAAFVGVVRLSGGVQAVSRVPSRPGLALALLVLGSAVRASAAVGGQRAGGGPSLMVLAGGVPVRLYPVLGWFSRADCAAVPHARPVRVPVCLTGPRRAGCSGWGGPPRVPGSTARTRLQEFPPRGRSSGCASGS